MSDYWKLSILEVSFSVRALELDGVRKIDRLSNVVRDDIEQHGVRGPIETMRTVWDYVVDEVRYAYRHESAATNVYEREWDALLILDCATVELLEAVEDEYGFVDDVGSHTSVGTCSGEWMRRTFTDEYRDEMERTVYVNANTSSENGRCKHVTDENFRRLENVWKHGWDDELGTVPARTVTDWAVHYGREYDPERLIVHYMQPHSPFLRRDGDRVVRSEINETSLDIGELYERGYSRREIWNASVENLRYVLDDVELLLSNLDADTVVISSDHGQAFGEDGVWGHPCRTYVDSLTSVPWCVTSATDTGEYRPEIDPHRSRTEPELSPDEKLRALGYR